MHEDKENTPESSREHPRQMVLRTQGGHVRTAIAMTEQEVRDTLRARWDFDAHVESLFVQYLEAFTGRSILVKPGSLVFHENRVTCESDWTQYTMPLSGLWEPDFIEATRQERARNQEEQRLRQERNREANQKALEEAERQEYLRLKAKYEETM